MFCIIVEEHAEVFTGKLGKLPGIVHSVLNPDNKPVVRKIPVSVRDQFKVQYIERLGVITLVQELTECVSQIAFTIKKFGSLRVCIDPKPLNEALKRESGIRFLLLMIYYLICQRLGCFPMWIWYVHSGI